MQRILIATDGEEWDPQATAGAILDAIRAEEDFDLIVFGNESADSGNYQVGIRVAHALGRPVVTGLKGLSVEDGDTVRVETRRGTIELEARVQERVDEGVLFIPFHVWEAAANELTNTALDPTAKIPELKVCSARVSKA